MEIGFMRPERLWALLIVPVMLGVYLIWTYLKRSRSASDGGALTILFPKRKAWKRHVAVVAAIATLASLTLAWATPNGYIDVPKDRATVFLVVDVSLSMRATDVPPNRLAAAQDAAKEFVSDLPDGYNIAVISFSAVASLLLAPTTDHRAAELAIDGLTLSPSTAIGEGIYAALDALTLIPPDPDHPDEPAPAVIVLISDGETNSGRNSHQAAEASKALQIPVFTIAFGTPNGYIMTEDGHRNQVPVNKEELRVIATITGGKAYSADSLPQLREVYSGISRSIGYERQKNEITGRFVGYGTALSIIALLGVMSLAARWP